MGSSPIKALFLDIGGIFLTNGWDRRARQDAANHFAIDFEELNERHRIIFDAYESGKMSLDEYLKLLVFYEDQPFSIDDFKQFMLAKSAPYPDMIALVKDLKERYQLLTVAVNNEGKEINQYRIKTFGLKSFIDVFASSCIVYSRKPDREIYRIALDMTQYEPQECIYLDDRLVFIQAATQLGINGIHHTSLSNTKKAFESFGLI